jgi:hypothetical protein
MSGKTDPKFEQVREDIERYAKEHPAPERIFPFKKNIKNIPFSASQITGTVITSSGTLNIKVDNIDYKYVGSNTFVTLSGTLA